MKNERTSINITPLNTFLAAFFLILFVLKVCEVGIVANWSWWWITAPLWAPIAIFSISFIIGLLLIVFIEIIKYLISIWDK